MPLVPDQSSFRVQVPTINSTRFQSALRGPEDPPALKPVLLARRPAPDCWLQYLGRRICSWVAFAKHLVWRATTGTQIRQCNPRSKPAANNTTSNARFLAAATPTRQPRAALLTTRQGCGIPSGARHPSRVRGRVWVSIPGGQSGLLHRPSYAASRWAAVACSPRVRIPYQAGGGSLVIHLAPPPPQSAPTLNLK